MTKLTAEIINEAQPSNKPVLIWDDELRGFHLRIMPSGVKTYRLFYRSHGRQRWLTLGRQGAITPKQARNLAKQRSGEIAAGHDPAAGKRMKRQAMSGAKDNTCATVAERFLADRRGELRRTTLHTYTGVLNNVPKTWQARPVEEITRKDVIAFLDRLKADGKLAMATLSLRVLSVFFGWCLDRELISTLPTTRIRLPSLKPRERALSLEELRRVWAASNALGGVKGAFVQILMLTGQRRRETSLMRWQDLQGLGSDNALWNLPGENTKNGRPHQVPLSQEAQAIIRRLPRLGPHVFTFDGNRAMAVPTCDRIKREIDEIIAKDGQTAIEPRRLHDLRRSLVTGMHEHDLADPHTIEVIVNHVGGLRGGIAGSVARQQARRRRGAEGQDQNQGALAACGHCHR